MVRGVIQRMKRQSRSPITQLPALTKLIIALRAHAGQDVRAPSLNTQLPAAGKATGSWVNCFRGERLKREQATVDEPCRRALRCGPGCPRQLFYVGPAFAFLCVPVQRDLRNLDQVQVVPLQAVTFFVRDLQIPMDMLVTVIKSDFEALATG